MSFWNEAFYFEKHGDRYVYRPNVFSKGYDISESEKDHLSRELTRLQWRSFLEGLLLLVLIAALFMTGAIESRTPLPWFMIFTIAGLAILAVTAIYRTDRLCARVLGHRRADLPRLPLRQALATPRPLVTKRFAIPVLQSVIALFALATAAGNGLVVYVVAVAYRARLSASESDVVSSSEDLFALTAQNPAFWAVVVLFNGAILAGILFWIRQVRRLRAMPDLQ